MKQLHQNLQESFPWYKRWHENRSYKALHYALLILAIAITASIVFSSDAVKAAPTTYYVATNGNDGNAGTQAAPWKTVAKACNTVVTAGDTIHIVAGTYVESAGCNLAKGVNMEGEGKTSTIVKSSITGTWSNYMNLESPAGTMGNQSISNFTLDGQTNTSGNASGTWMGIVITGRSNVSVHDMKFTNFFDTGTIFAGHETTNPTNWNGPYATGNSYYNNDGTNCAGIIPEAGMSGSACLMIGGQDGMEIHHNNLNTTARPLSKNGWPIKYWDNGFLKGVKIYHNTFIKSPFQGTSPWAPPDWDFAVEFFNVKGMEFANNYVQGSVDINYVYKDTYAYGLWAHDNILDHATPNYNHAESGFIFEFKADTNIVENNIVNNVGVGISYNTRTMNNTGGYNYGCGTGGCSAIIDNVIRNNLFSNIYSMGGVSGGIVTQSEQGNDVQVINMKIYNNTIVAKSGQPSYTGIDFTSQQNGNINGMYIRNNIIQGFSANSIIGQAPAVQSNVLITHNDTWNNVAPIWGGSGVTMNNNLNVAPGFVSSTDFHLQATSPLIDKGIDVGLPFNGAAPDIGAFETGVSGPDVTPPVVTSTAPTNASTGVAITVNPTANFSEALNAGTVTSASAYITQGATPIQAAVNYSNNSVVLTPTAPLATSTTYTVTPTTAITDVIGNHLAGNYTFSFTTAAAANLPPTSNAGPDQTITLPTNSVTMAGVAGDPNGAVASTMWSKFSGPAQFNITTPSSLTTTITGLTVGTYVFRLAVTDNGTPPLTTNDDVSIIVKDTTAPTVSLTAPATGSVSGTVAVSATASDNVAVDHVDFHIDGVYTTTIGTDATSPYSINWNSTLVPDGAHTLTARAYDTSGNFTTSSSVAITVANGPQGGGDSIPPTVSITSPTAGSTVSGNVIITASAGDASGVAQVKFYRGTTLIGSDTCGTGPTCNAAGTYNFAVTWNTTGLSSGAYSLTAVAYDTAGNVATSSAVSVNVGIVIPTGGSFTTWNPADKGRNISLSNGNLTEKDNGFPGSVRAKTGKSSGKWYWEIKVDSTGTNADFNFYPGVSKAGSSLNNYLGSNAGGYGYWGEYGDKRNSAKITPYGPSFEANGTIIGMALDMDAKTLKYYKKSPNQSTCTDLGVAFTGLSGVIYPAAGQFGGDVKVTANFGASPFACPVPAGFNPGVTQ